MKDLYLTRKTDKYSIIHRVDKVSYKKPKLLTNKQFNYYNNNGFLILKRFFNKKTIEIAKNESNYLFENNKEYYVNKEPETNKVRSILKLNNNKKLFSLLDNRIRSISESILGGSVYVHQSRINYKDGAGSSGWNWHSDFETWHSKDGMSRMRCLTAMIAINDNTINNGCLNFIPKSHLSYISCKKISSLTPEGEFSIQIEGIPDSQSIITIKEMYGVKMFSAVCDSGDLILFDCNTLHYSDVNKTNNKRTNIYFVLNSNENKLVKPFNSEHHRPIEMGFYTNN